MSMKYEFRITSGPTNEELTCRLPTGHARRIKDFNITPGETFFVTLLFKNLANKTKTLYFMKKSFNDQYSWHNHLQKIITTDQWKTSSHELGLKILNAHASCSVPTSFYVGLSITSHSTAWTFASNSSFLANIKQLYKNSNTPHVISSSTDVLQTGVTTKLC